MKQIRIVPISRTESKVFVKQHNFFAGIINSDKRMFYMVPRTSMNIFRLLHEGGGLGINIEILHLDSFDEIILRFNSELLRTYRLKWIHQGIVSPFGDFRVDSQIILPLSEINLDWEPKCIPELTLFDEVG